MTGYSVLDTVIAFGLDADTLANLEAAAASCKARVFQAECLTDLIAIPNLLTVIDAIAVDTLRLAGLFEDLLGLDDPALRVALIGGSKVAIPRRLRSNVWVPVKEVSSADFKFAILRQREHLRQSLGRAREADRRIFRLMYVLRELNVHRHVTSIRLAEQFNVTPRTILRDLQLLQCLGEVIDYDPITKRYVVPEGWHPFSGHLLVD